MAAHVLRKAASDPPPARDSDAIPVNMCTRCGMIHSPAIDEYDCIAYLRDRLAMLEQRPQKPAHR